MLIIAMTLPNSLTREIVGWSLPDRDKVVHTAGKTAKIEKEDRTYAADAQGHADVEGRCTIQLQ